MLLAVVLFSFTLLLPTTLGLLYNERKAHHTNEDKVELRTLLEKLRERLEKNEDEKEEYSGSRGNFGSIHDDFNEERSLLDEVRSSRGESRGTGLHTYRSKTVRQESSLTADQQTQLVDAMNARRRSVGAADMYKLHWNAKLARLAQDWSSKCNFVHGYTPYNYDEYDNFTVVGANLWAYQGSFDASKIVDSWYNDRVNFNRITQNCEDESSCGGYKQLVTSYTTDVGCGLSTCGSISSASSSLSNANFIVCYFGPAGNYLEKSSFTAGPSCTLCKYGQFYCDNGLCDKTCTAPGANCVCQASCKQCSTQTSDCKCTCNPGSDGVDCGLPCKDNDVKCGKRGFTATDCQNPNNQHVRDTCRLFCKQCQEGSPCSGGGGGGDSQNNAGGGQPEKLPAKPVNPPASADDGAYVYFDDI